VHLVGFYYKNKRNKHVEFQGQNRLSPPARNKFTTDSFGPNETGVLKFREILSLRPKSQRCKKMKPGQLAEAPRFQDNRHMKVVSMSTLRTGRVYPPGKFLVHNSVRD
jgi:hypothetical protein